MPNTSVELLIVYEADYDQEKKVETKTYLVTRAGGLRSYMEVGVADGNSTEFPMRETLEKLEQLRAATAGGWNPARRFEELPNALKGDALAAYDEVVARDYPAPRDKTDFNYVELQRQIITTLSDHVWPGDKVHQFLSMNIEYMDCKSKMKDGTERVEKPTKVLSRMQKIRRMGSAMHHTMGAHYMTDEQFDQAFWLIFPTVMVDWLTNEQNIDPFAVGNLLNATQIGDHMQYYWNKKLKDPSHASKRKRDDEEEIFSMTAMTKKRTLR